MNLAQFTYSLPPKLIAKYPSAIRSASRLLTLNTKTGEITHQQFANLSQLINSRDLLVFNNTQVLPARLYGKKDTGGKIEILIERILTHKQALARVKASKKLKTESLLRLENDILVKVLDTENEFMRLEFLSTLNVLEILEHIGHMPLPPYLARDNEPQDRIRYQTLFAKVPGAVAAPTAGLHFDANLLQSLRNKQIAMAEVTLHVGSGTFQPIRVSDIKNHKMHPEYMVVNQAVYDKVRETKQCGGRVIAVGTTTVRALESASLTGNIQPYQGDTDIFIYPGFKFNCVDAMITNFHLPESTLLILASAFAGFDQIMQAYQQAIAHNYRFYSYGDAMLIFST